MPYLPTAQAWLTQSALLLEARPTTTRITTKYTLTKPTLKRRSSKPTKSDPTAAAASTTDPAPAPAASEPAPALPTTRAILTLKTYNPASGVTLKYKTDKAAEVGRLVSSLARLGRSMAGLPEVKEDIAMLDAHNLEGGGAAAEVVSEAATPVPEGVKGNPAIGGQPGGGASQGGKKGRKKGKK